MGEETNFNQRQCIRALKRLGFVDRSKRRKHFKFYPPENIAERIAIGSPQFIIIPNHRELKVQKLIIQEIKSMGGEELVRKFLDNL